MVRHWWRDREPGWRRSIADQRRSAPSRPALVAVIFAVAKFALGAWLIVIVIPVLVGAMLLIRRAVRASAGRDQPSARRRSSVRRVGRQRVIVPVADVTRDVVHALTFARTMSDDVTAVHVTDDAERASDLRARFERQVPGVPFVIVESPYRSLVRPLVRYLEDAVAGSRRRRGRRPAAGVRAAPPVGAVPLQRQRRRIREALLGRPNVLVVDVPYRRDV